MSTVSASVKQLKQRSLKEVGFSGQSCDVFFVKSWSTNNCALSTLCNMLQIVYSIQDSKRRLWRHFTLLYSTLTYRSIYESIYEQSGLSQNLWICTFQNKIEDASRNWNYLFMKTKLYDDFLILKTTHNIPF